MRYFEKQAGFWDRVKGLFGRGTPSKGELLRQSIKGSAGYDDIVKGMLANPRPKSFYGSQGLNEQQYLANEIKKGKVKY